MRRAIATVRKMDRTGARPAGQAAGRDDDPWQAAPAPANAGAGAADDEPPL